MKIDRLIGIVTVLLQHEKVTAAALAGRFEVSTRTIHRDIEALCLAGIPVVTLQGSNGGITIAEGYRVDKTLFTREELRSVLAGLGGLDSVAQDGRYRSLMGKLFPAQNHPQPGGPVRIDLASHYKDALAPKISAIQQAIDASVMLSFAYCGPSGERAVLLAPYFLAFQWSAWYVFGFDGGRADFRLFKLNRLTALEVTSQPFQPREIPAEKLPSGGFYTDEIQAVILFNPCVKYRLTEEYGPGCYEPLPDGTLRFSFPFTSREYLLEWVLRFGDKAELVEPAGLRREVKARLGRALLKYPE